MIKEQDCKLSIQKFEIDQFKVNRLRNNIIKKTQSGYLTPIRERSSANLKKQGSTLKKTRTSKNFHQHDVALNRQRGGIMSQAVFQGNSNVNLATNLVFKIKSDDQENHAIDYNDVSLKLHNFSICNF
jgi:hypothetical protein